MLTGSQPIQTRLIKLSRSNRLRKTDWVNTLITRLSIVFFTVCTIPVILVMHMSMRILQHSLTTLPMYLRRSPLTSYA